MQIHSSVSDNNQALFKVSFYQQRTSFFTVDFWLTLSCSIFSNDISCIHFPEHYTWANYDLVSKEPESWAA